MKRTAITLALALIIGCMGGAAADVAVGNGGPCTISGAVTSGHLATWASSTGCTLNDGGAASSAPPVLNVTSSGVNINVPTTCLVSAACATSGDTLSLVLGTSSTTNFRVFFLVELGDSQASTDQYCIGVNAAGTTQFQSFENWPTAATHNITDATCRSGTKGQAAFAVSNLNLEYEATYAQSQTLTAHLLVATNGASPGTVAFSFRAWAYPI